MDRFTEVYREIAQNYVNGKGRKEEAYYNNPIEYLDDLLTKITVYCPDFSVSQSTELLRWNYNVMKDKYKFHDNFNETFHKLIDERERYGKVCRKNDFTLLWDDHASLITAIQCDECGTIIIIDDSEEECLLRTVCPVCNKVEDKFYFEFIKLSDKKKWKANMLWAYIVNGDTYFGGNYSKAKFKLPKYIEWYFNIKRFFRNIIKGE